MPRPVGHNRDELLNRKYGLKSCEQQVLKKAGSLMAERTELEWKHSERTERHDDKETEGLKTTERLKLTEGAV